MQASERPEGPAVARAHTTVVMSAQAALLLASALAFVSAQQTVPANERNVFHEVFVWKHLDFAWSHDSDKARALDARLYQPENCAIHSLRVWHDRLFLTLPRWREGVPATLTTLAPDAHQPAPPLEPFPSWDMQTPRNCSALQSAQAIDVTPEGRLWVVDGGRAPSLDPSPSGSSCPPKILIFDLDARNASASRLWKVIPVPQHVLSHAGDSAFADVAVDANDVAYISDASDTDPGVVVVDARAERAWKARDDRSMRADAAAPPPPPGLPGGVTALALARGPRGPVLFYAPMRAQQVYAVDAATLRDERAVDGGLAPGSVRALGNVSSVSQAMTAAPDGTLYLGLNAIHGIERWGAAASQAGSAPQKLLLSVDQERLQWPSAFAFDAAGSLWVVSNRLQNFLRRAVNVDEPNYRVMRAYVGGSQPPTEPVPRPEPGPTTSRSTRPDPYAPLDVAGNHSRLNYTTHTDDHSLHGHPRPNGAASHVLAASVMTLMVTLRIFI